MSGHAKFILCNAKYIKALGENKSSSDEIMSASSTQMSGHVEKIRPLNEFNSPSGEKMTCRVADLGNVSICPV